MATSLAASYHGVEVDGLRYQVVNKRHGFLKSRRRVVIEVDPERLIREPGEALVEPTELPERAPLESHEIGREGRYLVMATEMLLEFAGVDVAVQAEEGDEALWLNLVGSDEGRLLSEGARLLESLDVLVPRLSRGLGGDSFGVRLDCRGIRRHQHERLKRLAKESAGEALESGGEIRLEPMNSAERRLVHRVVAEIEGVETKSDGVGPSRHVVIRRT
jgi:spoIIIJ-associated protein